MPTTLDEAFKAVNASGSGQICASELQRALGLGGMTFSLQTCALMVRLHDVDGDGTISRPEFDALHASMEKLAGAYGEAGRELDGDAFYAALQAVGRWWERDLRVEVGVGSRRAGY